MYCSYFSSHPIAWCCWNRVEIDSYAYLRSFLLQGDHVEAVLYLTDCLNGGDVFLDGDQYISGFQIQRFDVIREGKNMMNKNCDHSYIGINSVNEYDLVNNIYTDSDIRIYLGPLLSTCIIFIVYFRLRYAPAYLGNLQQTLSGHTCNIYIPF
jgi:hypothetical protein